MHDMSTTACVEVLFMSRGNSGEFYSAFKLVSQNAM